MQNLQDYKNQHSFDSASDEENSNRDLDAEELSSEPRSALIDIDPEELGMIFEKSLPSFIDPYYIRHPHSNWSFAITLRALVKFYSPCKYLHPNIKHLDNFSFNEASLQDFYNGINILRRL